MSASITLTRDNGYVDWVRDYRVMVDGAEIGRIGANEAKEFAIASGIHTVQMKIDWCGSSVETINAADGETIMLECGSSLRGWKILLAILYVSVWCNRYVWLRKAITL